MKIVNKPYLGYMSAELLRSLGISNPAVKVYLFPLDNLLFTLRLENLEDLLDYQTSNDDYKPEYIDLESLVWEFFMLANNSSERRKSSIFSDFTLELIELSLSGN